MNQTQTNAKKEKKKRKEKKREKRKEKKQLKGSALTHNIEHQPILTILHAFILYWSSTET